MEFKKEELVKSPLNYTGGKFKLLPQILPLLPNDINTFVDLFAGGCNVGINVKANRVICNDIESEVIRLMQELLEGGVIPTFTRVYQIIEQYNLSESSKYGYEHYNCDTNKGLGSYNKPHYERLRFDYNESKDIMLFYVMLIYAFNNQIRFNSKGNFNMPVGKRDFNKSIEDKLRRFICKLNDSIIFTNKDFKELNIDKLNNEDFVYCDPPYLVACASYNEQNGWNEMHERELLDLLDRLNEKGIRFALSNVLENKGKSNDVLKEWCKKYNAHYLNHTYKNCNYHAKDKSGNSTVEVLITNY